ncbi:MAG: glutamate--tRNA ligase family protein [Patescibacteria group bacterium]
MLRRIRGFFSRKKRVVTRFPPSPTGYLHIGRARTALFNYLYARKNRGSFIFRIEDTDKARSKDEYEKDIIESLKWLGLSHDNREIWRQSERTAVYKKYLEGLIEEGKAYISKEENPGQGEREQVIRFKNPNIKIKFTDLIREDVEFDTTELGDFVVARDVNDPVYHFAVVIDDFLSGVTHVIRGEDGISNTPRQILIQKAIGAPEPAYAHVPLILAADRSKLSGRHGAVSVREFREKGYLPQALVNYLALLGWNPGTDQEIFSLDELVEVFDLTKIQKGGAVFDEKKLRWINREHIKRLPEGDFEKELKSRIESSERIRDLAWKITDETIEKITPVIVDRIETYSDIDDMITARDLDFYFSEPQYDCLSLKWKDESDLFSARNHLDFIRGELVKLPEKNWNEENVKAAVWPYAENQGRGAVLWPFRYALSGRDKSPTPFTLASILGKETTLRRIEKALKLCLSDSANANNP